MQKQVWIDLFNGYDLHGWQTESVSDPGGKVLEEMGWLVVGQVEVSQDDLTRFSYSGGKPEGEGVLVNGLLGRTANFVSEHLHGDCELHIEFAVPQGSNSGVYLMGHYEIQILDSWQATEMRYGMCGGIYARRVDGEDVDGTPPRINASRPPGQWQSYDVVFQAPRFDQTGRKTHNAVFKKVEWNGVLVHEEIEVKGPTRATLPGPERSRGPLMIQGDHGPVAFRNMRIRELAGT